MLELPRSDERLLSRGEEIANSVSHGLGFLAALAAAPFLISAAIRDGDAASVTGVAVFAAAVALLYLASTVYHALPVSRAKHRARTLDHAAIFVMIAGTYTPFTLGVLRGALGWTLFGLVWGLAVLGVTLKLLGRPRIPALSTGLYVGMGWLGVFAAKPVSLRMPEAGLLWLLAGGLAYTAGVGFFVAKRLRWAHFLWHLCVLAGTACHAVAVYRYAA